MTLHAMWKTGYLQPLIEKKALKPCIVYYCKIYDTFKKLKLEYKFEEAVEHTAEKHHTSTATVNRAVRTVSK